MQMVGVAATQPIAGRTSVTTESWSWGSQQPVGQHRFLTPMSPGNPEFRVRRPTLALFLREVFPNTAKITGGEPLFLFPGGWGLALREDHTPWKGSRLVAVLTQGVGHTEGMSRQCSRPC